MELDVAIKNRRSILSFTKKKVSWKIILHALESSLHAPFAGNTNHLKFIIVEEHESIQKLATIAQQDWISQASMLIIVCSDDSNLEKLYGERGRIYGKQQAGAAMQNLLLKLTEHNIAGCWVGAFDDDLVRSQFMIPEEKQVEAIIAIGYEQPTIKSRIRKPRKRSLDTVLFWEKWDKDQREPLFKDRKA